ncbi:MAG: Uma2 family endonuclease [Candidatus Eremiobacteraeota bacterium]|nr:Uma2 family endonuclease [Candidatus Eremiobacteraeota bacterium]
MASLASPERRRVTPEEYLTIERQASCRSEYVQGEMFAMAGGSLAHDRITSNLGGLLHALLRGGPCEVLTSNMKVCTPSRSLFSYPDLTVVCGGPRFHDQKSDVLINPKVLFEVLSPSTEAFDRGKKRIFYQSLESLTDYVLVAQDEALVEHWARETDGPWLVTTLQTLESQLQLPSIGCALKLESIYERVGFADPGESS